MNNLFDGPDRMSVHMATAGGAASGRTRGWVWFGVLLLAALWSAFSWGVYALLDVGGAALASGTTALPFDPSALSWLAGLLDGLAGLGQGLVFVVWAFGALLLVGLGFAAQGFAPAIGALWRARKEMKARAYSMRAGGAYDSMRAQGTTPPPPPPGGAVYDVRPERVTQE